MKSVAALFVLLSLASCRDPEAGPVAPTPSTTSSVAPPPPASPTTFSWENYRGFSAFALLAQPDASIEDAFREAGAHGWNTARVCAETEFWDGAYPYLRVPRDLERLRSALDVVARIPDAQVLLIGNCTLKRQVSLAEQFEWNQGVARVVRSFKNVGLEVVNELDNCRGRSDWGGRDSFCPGKQDARVMIDAARTAGVHEVTLDDGLCAGDFTLEFRFFNIGARPADFHPCRTRASKPWDPPADFLHDVVSKNRGLVLLSETVGYADVSGDCGGLRTCDEARIQAYVDRCGANPGCLFTFHSEAGLAGSGWTWWPEAR